MQFEDRQQDIDPLEQGNPFNPLHPLMGERGNDVLDELGNLIPGSQKYPGQVREAEAQSPDASQPGRVCDVRPVERQARESGASAQGSAGEAGSSYGHVDDVVADYGNTRTDPGQSGVVDV